MKVAIVLSLLFSVAQTNGKVIPEKHLVDQKHMTWPSTRGGVRASSYSVPPRLSHVAHSRFFDRGEVSQAELTRFAKRSSKRDRLYAELQSEYETIKSDPELQAELSQLLALTAKRERLQAELQSKYEVIASRVAEREKRENLEKQKATEKNAARGAAGEAWPRPRPNAVPAYAFHSTSGTFDPLQIYSSKLIVTDFHSVVNTMALAALVCTLAAFAPHRFASRGRSSGNEPLMYT